MEKSDEEIISQVLDGRKQAFSVLIKRYQRQIFNLMYRYSRSENDAADLTQEVFLRAYDKLSSFRSGRSFFSWLYTLAVNRANDWSRKQNRLKKNQKELQNSLPAPIKTNSKQEMILQVKEDLIRLQRAMQMLPENTREILMLRYHHDRSVKEVAEIFSTSESAVKMRTSRGLQQLQDIMQEGRFMKQYKIDEEQLQKMLHALPDREAPGELADKIMAEINNPRKRIRHLFSRLLTASFSINVHPVRFAGAACSLAAVFWLGLTIGEHRIDTNIATNTVTPSLSGAAGNAEANHLMGRGLLAGGQGVDALPFQRQAAILAPQNPE